MAQDTPEKSILEKLAQTQTFHPAGAKLFVPDWTLDPGDVVTVTSKKDVHDPDEDPTEYKVPIYSMDLTWNGTSRLDIQSTGNQEREPLSALRRKEYQTGRRGYGMAKELDDSFKEFETWQTQTDEVIGTYAAQFVDILGDGTNEGRLTLAETAIEQTASDATITAQAAGILLDEDGHPVLDERGKYQYDPNAANTTLTARINTNATNITTEVTRLDGEDSRLSGLIQTEAGKISQIVSAVGQNGEVTAGSIILAINKSKDGSATSTATITADAINLEGVVTAVFLDSRMANIENLFSKTGYSESITVQKSVNAGNVYTENLYIGDSLDNVQIHTYPIYLMGTGTTALDGITAAVVSQNSYMDLRHSHAITITPMSGDDEGKIQIQLGAAVTTDSSDRIKNFNIADTAFYKKRVGISSVDPGNWQYDSTEHKYYNPVAATAKDSTQANPDTVTANVFIPDITLTPVVNGLTYVGKVNAWGPSVSGTVYAAADELSLYLKEKDNYVYITKTDSDPVTVGPNSNVVARMEIQGGSGVDPKVSKSSWVNGSTTFTAGTSGQSSIPVSLSVVPSTSWSAATVPVNPTFRIDDGQNSTGLTCTFRLQVDNDYVYVKSNADNPVIGTNVLARQTNTAYADGQRSVSADFINVETQSAVTTLQAGDYGLYRTINGTAETNPIRYYRVAAGGGSSYYSTFLDKITLSNEDIGDSVQKYSVANYSDGHRDSEAKTRVVIDASAVYSAGVTAGLGGVVNVEKQPWDGNTCEFKPSAGDGTSASVTITAEPTKVSLENATSTGEIVLKDGSNQFATKNLYLRQRTLNGQNYVVLTDTSSIVSVGNVLAKYSASGGGGTGETRSVYNISDVVLSPADIGPSVVKYPTLYYDDETDDNTIPIYIDASAVYRRGQQDGAGISILDTYTTKIDSNNTTVTLLPSEKGDYNVMASARVTVEVSVHEGVQGATLLASTDSDTAWGGWQLNDYTQLGKKYGFIKITGKDQSTYSYGIDATDLWDSGVAEGAKAAGYQLTTVKVAESPVKYRAINVPTGTATVKGVTDVTAALYVRDNNGSVHLRGSAVSRYENKSMTLYYMDQSGTARPAGTGSWFFVSDKNVTELYRSGLGLSLVSNATNTFTVATGSRSAYVEDSTGAYTFYSGRDVSNTYFIRSN